MRLLVSYNLFTIFSMLFTKLIKKKNPDKGEYIGVKGLIALYQG